MQVLCIINWRYQERMAAAGFKSTRPLPDFQDRHSAALYDTFGWQTVFPILIYKKMVIHGKM